MKYFATFFPDPFDTGIRDVIIKEDREEFLSLVVNYLRERPVGFSMAQYDGEHFRALPRSSYVEINKRLGRF